MRQEDMERFAFLSLCGKRDQALIAGEEKMKFSDFERLSYITDYLGLSCLNIEICNQFSGQFEEQLDVIYRLIEQEEPEENGDDFRLQEEWLIRFCAEAPGEEAQKYLKRMMGIEGEETERADGT